MNNIVLIILNIVFLIITVVLFIALRKQIIKVNKSETIFSETLHSIEEELSIKNKKEKSIRDALAYGVTAYYIIAWENERLIDFYIEDDFIRGLETEAVEYITYTSTINDLYTDIISDDEKEETLKKLSIDSIKGKLEEDGYYEVLFKKNEYGYADHIIEDIFDKNKMERKMFRQRMRFFPGKRGNMPVQRRGK